VALNLISHAPDDAWSTLLPKNVGRQHSSGEMAWRAVERSIKLDVRQLLLQVILNAVPDGFDAADVTFGHIACGLRIERVTYW
jgi:hypothetical protein